MAARRKRQRRPCASADGATCDIHGADMICPHACERFASCSEGCDDKTDHELKAVKK